MKPEDTVRGEGPGEFYSPTEETMHQFGRKGKRGKKRGGKRKGRRRGKR